MAKFGKFLEKKNNVYGEGHIKAGEVLEVLYPDGIPVRCMNDASHIARCAEKMARIANRANITEKEYKKDVEKPWLDIAGYSTLMAMEEE